MSRWVLKGLKSGTVSSRYPVEIDRAKGISPGIIREDKGDFSADISSICPTGAISQREGGTFLDRRKCIHCMRCCEGEEKDSLWEKGFEWARFTEGGKPFPVRFKHSVHIRVVDVGDCGGCLNEIKLLNNPYYNMHRSGFFITPTPRKADVLLIVGRLTEHMKGPLIKAYEAMPSPKRVIAVGACALGGGIFEEDFITPHELSRIIPVDVEIPGCPPPPLSIYHGLLLISQQLSMDCKRT